MKYWNTENIAAHVFSKISIDCKIKSWNGAELGHAQGCVLHSEATASVIATPGPKWPTQ